MRTFLIVLLTAVLTVCSHAQKSTANKDDKEVIRGHVVADVASLAFGAGVGPRWTSFIFAVEQPNGQQLVRVAYAFYKRSQLPPDSFWNYTNNYEMRVKRDETCDTTVQSVSYEKNVDSAGAEIPPTFILQFTKNSPIRTLNPELKLPCFELWYSDYKQIKAEAFE